MKIKRSIFTIGSDDKNDSGEARSEGTAQPAAAYVHVKNDAQATAQ
jgi:hypothetical protein